MLPFTRLARDLAGPLWRPLRIALGLGSEAASLGALAGLGLLVLAQPAMRLTHDGLAGAKPLGLALTIRDRTGAELGRRGIGHETLPPPAEWSPYLAPAVLAIEDRRFREHWGVDPVGTARALMANLDAGGTVQGGSTITQQLAKSMFLSPERSIDRKVAEAFLAVWLEAQLGKERILALYLDRAYLGANSYGVEAAARRYFGRSARDLTLPQAARLAATLRSPTRYAPRGPGDPGEARAGLVLDRMAALGFIDRAARDAARRDPATVRAAPAPEPDGHALDWVERDVRRLLAAGRLGAAPPADLAVRTSLDADTQADAVRAVNAALDRRGERLGVHEGAALVMAPDGAVRALVGGRDYRASRFDRATAALRQPGSAFKPFDYLAALAYGGLRPDTTVDDEPICLSGWCPENYGRTFGGAMPLARALARSVNTVAVRLSVEIGRREGVSGPERQAEAGRARIVRVARTLGITTPLPDTPALPLGSAGVSLLELTGAYAVLANGGAAVEPYGVLSVATPDGRELYRRPTPPREEVVAPDLVAEMTGMLAGVVRVGSGGRAALTGERVAGKTGTSNRHRDAWFVGYTARIVAGIWFGNDDFSPTRGLTGGDLPAETWRAVVGPALRRMPPLAAMDEPERTGSVAAGATGFRAGAGFMGVPSRGGVAGFVVLSPPQRQPRRL